MTEETGFVRDAVIPAVIDNGQWAAAFGLSWTDMMLADQAGYQRIIGGSNQYIRKQAGTMGVAAARNEIVRYFLDQHAEWLFMVDSDMGFSGDTLDRMVESATRNRVPILGALCFAQKTDPDIPLGEFHAQRYRIQPTLYRYVEIESTGEIGFQALTRYKRDEFQSVAATGAACVLVHRSALEVIGPDPFMPITSSTGGGNGTPRTFSEDLSFCIRAGAADLNIGVDTSIKTTHYKGGIYLDEVTFAMQQETLIQAKGHEIARRAELALRYGGPVGPLGFPANMDRVQ